jgi:hypothetical protein
VGGILRTAFDKYYSAIASIVSPSASPSSSLSSSPISSNQSNSLAISTSTNESNQSGNYSVANAGLVVVPQNASTNASTTNANEAKLAQTITNSFSDDVTVTPGPNGTTGVITPEFRNVQGHDFLYVLVPVKTGTTTVSGSSSTQIQN